MHDLNGFESFRRERNKRRYEEGPLRPLGQNAAILREIEEADAREARNQQLTREVQDFFAEATRTAATIVAQVAESAEQQHQESVAHEMSDFLSATIRRAQLFVELMRDCERRGVAQTDVQPNMSNLVGPILDEFRFAGDASTAEAHVGQDPFATELDAMLATPEAEAAPQAAQPATARPASRAAAAPREEASPIEDHLVAEVLGTGGSEVGNSPDALRVWFDALRDDDQRLQFALKVLVRSQVMTKDEARAIYRQR